MDDLYSNLENYNDVNIVEELKNENKELKYKLEEYSNTMNQLQKDFDRLNSEYKKLELNYSSLLKTARAEIERKTQHITNLNREKDILVIKSIQNGQKNILNKLTQSMNREAFNKKVSNKNEGDREITNLNKNKLSVKTDTRELSRTEAHLLSPIDSVSSIGTTIKSTSSENNMRGASDKHSNDSKENILKNVLDQQHKERQIDVAKSKKIMDRRKSMPVTSNWDEKFSSDEEHGPNTNRHQDYEKKNNIDLAYGKSHKASEQTSYDSKNKYNKERYTEKYNPFADQPPRSRRMHYRHSPERDRYKSHRDRDYTYRSDYRQRVLKSPPLDNYGSNKSRYRRQRDKDWDYDNYNVKHNSRSEYYPEERPYLQEPDLKRRRIESASTDTERYERFVDRKSSKQSEYVSSAYDNIHRSCQSPDHDQFESNVPHHFIKEIRNTANVQLEDPRVTSMKYLPDKTDKGCFITAFGINAPIISIDRSQWGLEKIEVPEALKEKPSVVTRNDDLLKYIYKDIDELDQDTSALEHRQDPHIDNVDYMPVTTATPAQNKYNNKEDISLNKVHHESDLCVKAKDKGSKALHSHYKIPKKLKADSNTNIIHKEQATKYEINTYDKNMTKEEKTCSSNSLGNIMDVQDIEKTSNIELNNEARKLAPNKDNIAGDLELSDEASDIMDDIQSTVSCGSKINTSVNNQNKVDEDINDDYKSRTVTDTKHLEKTSEDILEIFIRREERNEVNGIYEEKKIENLGIVQEVKSTIFNAHSLEINPKDNDSKIFKEKSPKQIEEVKKRSSKKKREEKATERFDDREKHKSPSTRKKEKKRRSKDDTDKQKNMSVSEEKNTKEEMKSSKPQNKFTELFGESSSLITPDDLGIVKYDISTKRTDNYGSLFENTQDAIDLNVREIQKIQNTEEIASDVGLLPKLTTENNTQIPYPVDNKSAFEVEETHSAHSLYKNLIPADIESSVIKTVVISSGVQNSVEEEKFEKKIIPEHISDSIIAKSANKQLPVELLRAVATSTPFKTQCEISPRLTEVSSPSSESFGNPDVSPSNAGCSPATYVGGGENAPDVRIFLKRRRKIKKT